MAHATKPGWQDARGAIANGGNPRLVGRTLPPHRPDGGSGMRDGSCTAPAIFVVEDEKRLAAILQESLERQGYGVDLLYNGLDAVDAVVSGNPALIILDLMLPKLDGFGVCARIRAHSPVPILMLTARDAEEDKLRGFEVGADDYLTKPFSIPELLARVRALLRRSPPVGEATLRDGALELDVAGRLLRKGGEVVDLSVREFDLLEYLMRRPGQLISREQLLSEVWGYDYLGDSARTVDVTVWRLRSKIEDNPRDPAYVLSRRGVGYLFRPQG